MTIGQRIAEKRKELGLSQEALGQELGVSRQSVYKWESDAALPDIDKLVALSRRFGVTVGWLLGVEEPAPAGSSEPAEPLEPEQLAERIAQKYMEARPGMSRSRRLILKLAVIAAAVCLCFGMWRITDRLARMEDRYQSLMHSMMNLSSSVSSQISGITHRVEQAVKSQNQIAADYSATLTGADLAANTAAFAAMALPKEEAADLAVSFTAEYSPGLLVTVPGTRQADGSWRADLTCPLTDSINLSVVFESGGTRKNQRLELFTGLYTDSFPAVDVSGHSLFIFQDLEGENKDHLVYPEEYVQVSLPKQAGASAGYTVPVAEITDLRVGFFKNQQLVCWLEPIQGTPPNWHGFPEDDLYFKLSNFDLQLQDTDVVCIAAVVTDEYGRESVHPDMFYQMDPAGTPDREMTYSSKDWMDNMAGTWVY